MNRQQLVNVRQIPRLGFAAGAWDLLHPGHCRFLGDIKMEVNESIIALHVDPTIERPFAKQKPTQTLVERFVQVSEFMGFEHLIIPYETEADLIDILELYPITDRFIGADYIDKDFTGKDTCERLGITVHYLGRDHRFSSTKLRAQIADQYRN